MKQIVIEKALELVTGISVPDFNEAYQHFVPVTHRLSEDDYANLFAVWRTLCQEDRLNIAGYVTDITVEEMLEQIGLNNPSLFDRIEELAESGANVIEYLQLQIPAIIFIMQQLEDLDDELRRTKSDPISPRAGL